MKWPLLLLLFACSLGAADGPRLFFSRTFPGSVPPYFEVRLDQAGNVEYREDPVDDQPLTYRLPEADTRDVFGLAGKLDHFRRPLESRLKVAFTGTKLFRYEDGGARAEVKFNYSEDPGARALLDWFEHMGESAARRIEIERSAKYDRLGVVNALLLLQVSMERKHVVAPEQFLPVLDRIAKNQAYMHTARERAAELAASIRSSQP
jgi:hypothetical protein